ncbi:hypothetical protein HGRIS_012886 [Hohenbuehelia grisea]|uniref:WD40 repeat-like protein n=1 Tax=Hohenbuehelia grisea TaxID=104357 RepID=A0ABR3ITN9_9AGAR
MEDEAKWISLAKSLCIPAPISCLSSGPPGHICAGSDDGSVRVYDLTTYRVVTAIQGLGDEVTSVVSLPPRPPSEGMGDVWIACGRQVLMFHLDPTKMIQKLADAATVVEVLPDEDDVLNEVSLSANKAYLAFGADSGTVGAIDLSSKSVSVMKSKHSSICGFVKFIPNRPREIFSGGYDHSLMHFDFMDRKVLGQYAVPASSTESGTSLSPPFIMSTAVSPSGVFAAGTADGRLLVGFGGERRSGSQSKGKRSRKWEGLDESSMISDNLAEGPIIAVTFKDAEHLTLVTLLGNVGQYQLARDEVDDGVKLDALGKFKTSVIEKVNTMLLEGDSVVIGGLTKNGKGAIEVWAAGQGE